MIQIYYGGSAWGGEIVISREFFNPDTKDYIHIEAHEIGHYHPSLNDGTMIPGDFIVAFWVPDGNDGGHGFDGNIHHVVKSMQEYVPPPGFVEMDIPEDCRC